MSNKKNDAADLLGLKQSMELACSTKLGFVDQAFMCRSVGSLNPKDPRTVPPTATLHEVLITLRSNNMGCVLVVDASHKLTGIFSERDFITKVYGNNYDLAKATIDQVMTKEPMTVTPDTPLAFALNLMVQGGFRHVPVVDADQMPIGLLSVRDVVEALVEKFTADLMSMELIES